MFLSWEIEVQTVRTTDDALRELAEVRRPTTDRTRPYFDLVISDWSADRGATDAKTVSTCSGPACDSRRATCSR